MKGLSYAIGMLVILTLASPVFAGGLPDAEDTLADPAQEGAEYYDERMEPVRDTGHAALAPKGEELRNQYDATYDHVPSAVRDPAESLPDNKNAADDAANDAPEHPGNVATDVMLTLRWGLGTAFDVARGTAQDADRMTNGGFGVLVSNVYAVRSTVDDASAYTARYAAIVVDWTMNKVSGAAMFFGPDSSRTSYPAYTAASAATTSTAVAPASQIATSGLLAVGGLSAIAAGFAVARKMLSLGGVALLSRIQKKDIMKNETRASVYSIVQEDPGVSLNEIVDRLGVSRNAVAYHLAVFESEKDIVSVKDGKYRRYFVNGGKFVNGAKDVVSALKNDTTRQVIEFITRHPGTIQKDVCASVGTSPSATNWHINRLAKVGLVTKEKVANTVQYGPGPAFEKYDLADFGFQGMGASDTTPTVA